jgi:hypothetical protein
MLAGMRLSSAQVKILSDENARRFEDRCVEMIRKSWRDEAAHLDDAALREVVRERIASGARYGFTGQRDLFRFINLSFYLGLDFEQRPELDWAVELLERPRSDLGETAEEIIRLRERGRSGTR